MKTISLFNLKGGVGKTTVTVNLAYNLSTMGLRILVVDMDPQVNTTPIFCDVSQKNKTIKDVLETARVGRSVYRSRYERVDIIKGDHQLKETYAVGALNSALRELDGQYDVILIDCRPSFEALTQNAVFTSDIVLTPIILDRFCLDNLKLVQQLLNGFETSHPLEWHVFCNRVRNVKSQMAIYQEITTSNEYPFLTTCIEERAAVPNALAYRKPVKLHQSGSPATRDFWQLANEVRGLLN